MKFLIDTNIILDLLLQREPFFQEAEILFEIMGNGQILGYVSATTLTDIFYIAKRQTQSIERANQAIALILRVLEICPVDRTALELALASKTSDFEDAVQIACALSQGLDGIVTRDAKFDTTSVTVLSVNELFYL